MAEEKGFEAGLEALEALVGKLEGGELPLEEAMKRFEEGMLLSGKLSEKLETARRKVEQLTQDKEGKASLKPFPDPAFDDEEGDAEDDDAQGDKAKPARKAGKGKAGKPQDSLF